MGLHCATRNMISAVRATHFTEISAYLLTSQEDVFHRSIHDPFPHTFPQNPDEVMGNTRRFRAEPVNEFNLRDSIQTHRCFMYSDPQKKNYEY